MIKILLQMFPNSN